MSDNAVAQKSSLLSSIRWLEKRAFRIVIALLGLVIILAVMTVNVAKYESHLATGGTVLLELAPVDPRGFMQGDYMTLNYALGDEVLNRLRERLREDEYRVADTNGYVIIALDENKVGKLLRLTDNPNILAANEMAIYYRVRNDRVKLATNAFFFQEGQAEAFEAAEYGLFRVNNKGEPLLTNMVNENFEVIIGVNSKNLERQEALDNLNNRDRQNSGM